MIALTEKEKKRFSVLLINTCACYWFSVHDKSVNYLERCDEIIDRLETGRFTTKYDRWIPELKEMIVSHEMTDSDIHNFISTMENPRRKWNDRMKEHNKGGIETRDNKGQFVNYATYRTPTRYNNGNIDHCNFNKIRYPKKCRSKKTWKKFYEMFPAQAALDNWDGTTSDRMR